MSSQSEWKWLLPLADSLSKWNLDDYIDEIIDIIFGPRFLDAYMKRGIQHWNQQKLLIWVERLTFLEEDLHTLKAFIQKELLDGETFELLFKQEGFKIVNISYTSSQVITFILQNWWNPIFEDVPITLPGIPLGEIFVLLIFA